MIINLLVSWLLTSGRLNWKEISENDVAEVPQLGGYGTEQPGLDSVRVPLGAEVRQGAPKSRSKSEAESLLTL